MLIEMSFPLVFYRDTIFRIERNQLSIAAYNRTEVVVSYMEMYMFHKLNQIASDYIICMAITLYTTILTDTPRRICNTW